MPLRRCAGCRRSLPQAELLRLAVLDGRVVADPQRRLPGRGAYLCRRPGCAERALRGGLARALRIRVPIDPEVLNCQDG